MDLTTYRPITSWSVPLAEERGASNDGRFILHGGRWVRILMITGGSSMAAMIFKAPPAVGAVFDVDVGRAGRGHEARPWRGCYRRRRRKAENQVIEIEAYADGILVGGMSYPLQCEPERLVKPKRGPKSGAKGHAPAKGKPRRR